MKVASQLVMTLNNDFLKKQLRNEELYNAFNFNYSRYNLILLTNCKSNIIIAVGQALMPLTDVGVFMLPICCTCSKSGNMLRLPTIACAATGKKVTQFQSCLVPATQTVTPVHVRLLENNCLHFLNYYYFLYKNLCVLRLIKY